MLSCTDRDRGIVPRALDFGGLGAHHPRAVEVDIESEIDVLRAEVQHQGRVMRHVQVHVLEIFRRAIRTSVARQGSNSKAVFKGGKLVLGGLVP